MAIRAYADKHGIGIYEESDDARGPSDLRLDDVNSFLTFVYELLAASKEMGWFEKTAHDKWGKVVLLLSELYELFERFGHTIEVFNKTEDLMEAYDEWLD